MPRSADEKRANARKYGRRQAVLEALRSAQDLERAAQRLLRDLKAAGAKPAQLQAHARALAQYTDITRRRAAVWSILDALEAIERAAERPRTQPKR